MSHASATQRNDRAGCIGMSLEEPIHQTAHSCGDVVPADKAHVQSNGQDGMCVAATHCGMGIDKPGVLYSPWSALCAYGTLDTSIVRHSRAVYRIRISRFELLSCPFFSVALVTNSNLKISPEATNPNVTRLCVCDPPSTFRSRMYIVMDHRAMPFEVAIHKTNDGTFLGLHRKSQAG